MKFNNICNATIDTYSKCIKSDFQAMTSKSLSLSPSFAMFFVNRIPIKAGFEGSNLHNKKKVTVNQTNTKVVA